MLDQSFSQKSFREIFDIENRKGNNIEKRFKDDFSVSLAKTLDLKRINKQIREENNFNKKKELYTQRKTIKIERENIIEQKLEEISNQINRHSINILEGEEYGGQSYKLEKHIQS